MTAKILIVDDDEYYRDEMCGLLEGYGVSGASSGEEALRILRRPNEIELVILDVVMPGMDGLNVLTEIKKTEPGIRIIIITGRSSKDTAIEALRAHADDYIEKPADPDKIKSTVERLLESDSKGNDIDGLSIEDRIEKVKRFIERNCCKKVTLKEASGLVCLSPKYLSRIFAEHTKKNFVDYKIALRIERAKEFLRNTGNNINQIAYKTGYENTESLIRQFKKVVGRTPRQYRDSILKNKKDRKGARSSIG